MSEGMTDEAFHAEIDELDKQGRYALAMVRATREADRARASETEKAAEIERLKAELARLTPSGQVAEDRNIVAMELGSHPSQAKTQAAAARLAAQAQGYEVMKVERDAAVAESSTHLEWMKEERTRAEQAEKERDAVLARAEEAEKQARLAWERHAEKDRAYGGAISQRDAAVADNAAQREVFRHILERFESPFGGTADDRMRATVAACTQALARPHPGAAILKERKEFHARLDAIETAVVETVGGKVEGAPVSRINYLQRLRELVIIEQAFVALSRLRAGDAAEQARQSETIKALEGALTTIAERGVSSTDRRIARDALHLAGRLP